MFKSWKTSLAGILGIGCTIAAIFFPEQAVPIGKIGAVVTAGGLFLSKDHDQSADEEAPKTDPPSNTGTPQTLNGSAKGALTLGMLLMGLFLFTTGFIGTGLNKAPYIYVGMGNPTNFVSGVGSFYVDLSATNVPTLWVKTSTNGFARFISSNALPADVTFRQITCTNILASGDVSVGGTLSVSAGGIDCGGDLLVNGGATVVGVSEFVAEGMFDGNAVFNTAQVNGLLTLPSVTTNKFLRVGGNATLEATSLP